MESKTNFSRRLKQLMALPDWPDPLIFYDRSTPLPRAARVYRFARLKRFGNTEVSVSICRAIDHTLGRALLVNKTVLEWPSNATVACASSSDCRWIWVRGSHTSRCSTRHVALFILWPAARRVQRSACMRQIVGASVYLTTYRLQLVLTAIKSLAGSLSWYLDSSVTGRWQQGHVTW